MDSKCCVTQFIELIPEIPLWMEMTSLNLSNDFSLIKQQAFAYRCCCCWWCLLQLNAWLPFGLFWNCSDLALWPIISLLFWEFSLFKSSYNQIWHFRCFNLATLACLSSEFLVSFTSEIRPFILSCTKIPRQSYKTVLTNHLSLKIL